MKAAEDEFMENALPHIQARFCDSGLGSNIKLKIADYFPVRNVGQASEVTIQDRTLEQTVTRRIERNPEVDLVAILTDDTITQLGQSQVVGIAFTYAVCKTARGADRDKVSISEFGSSLDRFVSVSWKLILVYMDIFD